VSSLLILSHHGLAQLIAVKKSTFIGKVSGPNPRIPLFKCNLLQMLHKYETKCCSPSCSAHWTGEVLDFLPRIFAMMTEQFNFCKPHTKHPVQKDTLDYST
jgi:hypothetical protein